MALPTQPGTRPAGTGEIRTARGVVNESALQHRWSVTNITSIAVTDWRTPRPAMQGSGKQPLHAEVPIPIEGLGDPLLLVVGTLARMALLPTQPALER